MRSIISAILALSIATSSALAAQAPPLPESAKKLTAAQIAKLYDGKTYSFTSYTRFGVATGTVTYDLKNNKSHGSYQLGWHHGTIDGRIRMEGDHFCYKVGIDWEHCDFIYVDGDSVYDVDPDGTVQSVNKKV